MDIGRIEISNSTQEPTPPFIEAAFQAGVVGDGDVKSGMRNVRDLGFRHAYLFGSASEVHMGAPPHKKNTQYTRTHTRVHTHAIAPTHARVHTHTHILTHTRFCFDVVFASALSLVE